MGKFLNENNMDKILIICKASVGRSKVSFLSFNTLLLLLQGHYVMQTTITTNFCSLSRSEFCWKGSVCKQWASP
jgi:hypothetical protein